MNQHGLLFAQPGAGDQHVPGSQEVERNCGRFGKRQARRLPQQILRRHGDFLGGAAVLGLAENPIMAAQVLLSAAAGRAFSAGDPGSDHNFVPDTPAARVLGEEVDHSAYFASWNDRQGEGDARNPAANPKVEMIQRHRADGDDRSGPIRRFWNLGQLQPIQATVFANDDRAHCAAIISAGDAI